MNKVNIFYQMDKGFFGKTLCTSAKKCVANNKPSIKMDSIDDLNRYFQAKMFAKKIDKTPSVDTFSSAVAAKKSDDCFSIFNQILGLI